MNKNLYKLPTYNKIILFLIISALVLLFSIFLIAYQSKSKSLLEMIQMYLQDIQVIVSDSFDTDLVLKSMSNHPNKEEYIEILKNYTKEISEINPRITVDITKAKLTDEGLIEVIVFNTHEGNKNLITDGKLFIEPTVKYKKTLDKMFTTGETQTTKPIKSNGNTYILSLVPIFDLDGQIIGIYTLIYDYSMVIQKQTKELLSLSVIFVIILVGVTGTITIFLRKEFKPLAEIFKGIQEISKGNFNHKIIVEEKNEYTEIINSFNEMVANLKVLFEGLENTTKELKIKDKEILIDQLENAINEVSIIKNSVQYQQDLQNAEKMNAIGQLAASVAHEIRNPLTVVKGFIQLFDMKTELTETEKSFIELMATEIERAETIINDYLALAKPELNDAKVVSLKDTVIKVHSLMHSYAVMNNNIEILLKISSNPLVIAYGNELVQLLVNIVKNGIEAMKDGGKIEIKVYEDEKSCYISISDTGVGMSNEVISRLGTPFYSLKEKGTGIGMMVCYQIVNKMKGQISVSSELNVGTTFLIELPKADNI